MIYFEEERQWFELGSLVPARKSKRIVMGVGIIYVGVN